MAGESGADDHEEVLEIVDEDNNVVGTAPRHEVHRQGLLHRAAYCWFLDDAGRVLLQQRAHTKRIGPGLWDVSVAEHVDPGESYCQAAARGLREELGVQISEAALEGPLSAPFRRSYAVEGMFSDQEFVQAYIAAGHFGAVHACTDEVADTIFVAVDQLERDVAKNPGHYTPWLRKQLPFLIAALRSSDNNPQATAHHAQRSAPQLAAV